MTDFDNIVDNVATESAAADSAGADSDAAADTDGTDCAAATDTSLPAAAADDAGGDGMSKLAIVAGFAAVVAVCVVIFLALQGPVCSDALTGPIAKNTYVRFGRFIQNKKEPEPIIWLVADIQGDEAFLISQKILDWRNFYDYKLEDEEMPYWETSSLRKYLNRDFYNTAFNEEEKELICVSHLKNFHAHANTCRKQPPANDTDDKVFVPSYRELDELMPVRFGKKGRRLNKAWRISRSMVTQYAIGRGAQRDYAHNHFFSGLFSKTNRSQYYPYWLRTHYFYGYMMTMSDDVTSGDYDYKYGVRPALRIKVK
ncbi:MAG: DUF6273 domain-containing protein [bacterium]|nr:DUF6273 domain-containing protein [bacterium]